MSKSSNMEHLRHELFSEITAHATVVLNDHGIDPEVSEQCAMAICDQLAENWGGQLVTIPKNYAYKLAQRDLEIYDKFNGHNCSELAKEYKMSVRGIYKILKRIRRPAVALKQRDMFGSGGND